MNTFLKIHVGIAWLIWLIVTIVYVVTAESSISFWESGDLVSSAYSLQIGQAPGAPFYMLIARFFSMFAFGNVQHVAFCITMVSVLASSFTVLFLYWSVTYIAKRVIERIAVISPHHAHILVIFSGSIASLSFAFSDTFWSQATQSGIYALSSLLTAIIFWAMLQWEKTRHHTWILCIVLCLGLSVGVNLLILFVIPALILVYYFKQYSPTILQSIVVVTVSIVAVCLCMWAVVYAIPNIAFAIDLVCVNTFSMPVNSGFIVFLVICFAILCIGIYYTHLYNKPIINFVLIASVLFCIAYSSYALIVIRSAAQPPHNQNNPEHAYNFMQYISQQATGNRPLVYGKMYNAAIDSIVDDSKVYEIDNKKYSHIYTAQKQKFNKQFLRFFPRMWSADENHIPEYKQWAGVDDGKNTVPMYVNGVTYHSPTWFQNIRFFVSCQLNHMYIRYFMWNFAGKQNDLQGNGEPHKGNWISGIPVFDSMRLGPQDVLPDSLQNNKARNTYFFIPFLLGIAGLLALWFWHKKFAAICVVFFICTGVVLVLYLNQTPLQARERDYLFVGSFYMYSLFIGLGVISLYMLLRQYFTKHVLYIALAVACISPIILFSQNIDDHNRSGRSIAHDFSKNLLETCKPNAILFTYGDNETFPLWYLQTVEGIRTDVRVVNLNVLSADWYIQSLKQRSYLSEPLPLKLPQSKYAIGTNETVFILAHSPLAHIYYPVQDIMNIIASDNRQYKAKLQNGLYIDYIPVPNLVLPVHSQQALDAGIISINDTANIVQGIPFSPLHLNTDGSIRDSVIRKNSLAMLDILAHAQWKRPIYFASTVNQTYMLNLHNYLYLHGLAYMLTPIEASNTQDFDKQLQIDAIYQNLMHVYSWGNCADKNVYVDEYMRFMVTQYRSLFANAAQACLQTNQNQKARNLVDVCMQLFPKETYEFDYFMISIADVYAKLGELDVSYNIQNELYKTIDNNLLYYRTVSKKFEKIITNDVLQDIGIAIELYEYVLQTNNTKFAHKIARISTLFIEEYFSFTRQISVCLPQEFQASNMWVFQLQGNMPYIAYWYNTMKFNMMHEQNL